VAAEALAKMGPAAEEAIPALSAATRHPEFAVIRNATAVLSALGAPALPALRRALRSDIAAVRLAAVWACADMGKTAQPVVPILTAFLDDTTYAVRIAAAEALGKIGAERAHAAQVLEHALRTQVGTDSLCALYALAELGPAGESAAPAILRLLRINLVRDRAFRTACAEALIAIGPPIIPTLIPLLNDEWDEMRMAAAVLLGRLGGNARSAVPALNRLLEDGNGDVAWEAMLALVAILWP
jgi:HEAT repeat protein